MMQAEEDLLSTKMKAFYSNHNRSTAGGVDNDQACPARAAALSLVVDVKDKGKGKDDSRLGAGKLTSDQDDPKSGDTTGTTASREMGPYAQIVKECAKEKVATTIATTAANENQ